MNKYLDANAELSKFSRNYMEHKKGLPIRPSEMGVLNIITGTPGPHTSVMLAELIGVSKPMITAHISTLEKKGYVVKEQSPEDKRIFYIKSTDKAQELVNTSKAEQNALLDRLVENVGQDNFDTLVELIRKSNKVIEAEIKEKTNE